MKKIKTLIALALITSAILTFSACSNSNNNTKGEIETESSDTLTESSKTENSVVSSDNGHSHDANSMFILDMVAVPSETEPGIINAVITVNHLHCGLMGVEFFLTYSSNTVEGVYTTNDEMAKSMTTVPTYDSTSGVKLPRFEQICTYKKASSIYECRYVDLLAYPGAVSGTKCEGLTKDGQLVITIPFKVNSDAKVGDIVKFDYINNSIKGTDLINISSVSGFGYSVTYTLTEKDIVG